MTDGNDVAVCAPSNPGEVPRWCAHLPGDTVLPTPSQHDADRVAEEVNATLRTLRSRSADDAEFMPRPTAHACAWPWDAESWREDCRNAESWLQEEDLT